MHSYTPHQLSSLESAAITQATVRRMGGNEKEGVRKRRARKRKEGWSQEETAVKAEGIIKNCVYKVGGQGNNNIIR